MSRVFSIGFCTPSADPSVQTCTKANTAVNSLLQRRVRAAGCRATVLRGSDILEDDCLAFLVQMIGMMC